MKKVRFKDMKQGKTLFEVSVFVHRDGTVEAYENTLLLNGRPFVVYHPPDEYTPVEFKQYFVNSTVFTGTWFGQHCLGYKHEFSLADRNIRNPLTEVPPHRYNMHAVFATRRQAKAYVARLKAGIFLPIEKKYLDGIYQREVLDEANDARFAMEA